MIILKLSILIVASGCVGHYAAIAENRGYIVAPFGLALAVLFGGVLGAVLFRF